MSDVDNLVMSACNSFIGTHISYACHAYTFYSIISTFYVDNHYLLLTLEGNGRQLKLPRGNFKIMIEKDCLGRSRVKNKL